MYNLAQLVLKVSSNAAAESFSTVERITTYVRATQTQVQLRTLAIEKNILLFTKSNLKKYYVKMSS